MNAPAHEFPCETGQRTGRVLVAGCGYLGLAVARQLHASGWEVEGVTREAESAAALCDEPFPVRSCDIADRAGLQKLGAFDAVIHTASSGHGGPDAYRHVFLEGARALIETFSPVRFIFTGSTSVYSQTDGSLVTEESPAEPVRETGGILLEAEAMVLHAGGTVARLAGIYGPDRWAMLEGFLSGRARLEGDSSRWVNQIHRADAAAALVRLLSVPTGIYNVSDGNPVAQRDVFAAFAGHFGLPLPPQAPPDPERKRGWSHKRVSNAKLTTMGWRPMYPSFREVLEAKSPGSR